MFLKKKILNQLFRVVLIKETSHLNEDGANVRFIGRILQRTREGILIDEDKVYFTQILKEFELIDSADTLTPATSTSALTPISEEPLNSDPHTQCRRVVGQLQWGALVRTCNISS